VAADSIYTVYGSGELTLTFTLSTHGTGQLHDQPDLQQLRSRWNGGHFTQNTQQSPGLGRSSVLQFWHS